MSVATRPPVTVVTPDGRPEPAGPPPEAPRRRGRAALVAVACAVPASLVVTDAVRDSRAEERAARRAAVAAEAAALSLAVVDVRRAPGAAGEPGSLVQVAPVDVALRNDGPVDLTVLDVALDGDEPAAAPGGTVLRSGAAVPLWVGWPVRCAEIGSVFDPQRLDLTVRGRTGARHRVEVRLDTVPGSAAAFRAAARRVCRVLAP